MTDKQIMIDGVDVSGCIYFKKNNKMPMCRACNSGVGSPYCEYHKDCYYKQLKHKEQEYEEFKKANDGILTTIRILAKNNIKLREILTEIKAIANDLFNMSTSRCMTKLELILSKISEA